MHLCMRSTQSWIWISFFLSSGPELHGCPGDARTGLPGLARDFMSSDVEISGPGRSSNDMVLRWKGQRRSSAKQGVGAAGPPMWSATVCGFLEVGL